MTHETCRERLVDLAYGELSRREAAEAEQHLAGCDACRAERDRLAATRAAMARLDAPPAPERGDAVLLAAARKAAEERRRDSFSLALGAFGYKLAAGTAFAVVAVFLVVNWKSALRPPTEDAAPAPAAAPAVAPAPPPGVSSAPPAPREGPRFATPPDDGPGTPAAPNGFSAEEPPRRIHAEKKVPPPQQGAGIGGGRGASAPATPAPVAAPRPLPAPPPTAAPAAPARPQVADEAGVPPERQDRVMAEPEIGAGRPEKKASRRAAPEAYAGPGVAAAPAGPPARMRSGAVAPAPSASAVAHDIERRHAANELSEAQKRFDPCPGGDVRRTAWIDREQRVVKLVRERADGMLVEEWFDDRGRLREALVRGTSSNGPWGRHVVVDEGGEERVEAAGGLAPDAPPPSLVRSDPTRAFFSGAGCEAAPR
ncbi:MAG TPA: zf-HC2 domain-containing protein [Anaeromyxobacteraceae bacterium]